MSWQIQTHLTRGKITAGPLDASGVTVNIGDGVSPDLPEDAVVTEAYLTPATGTVDPAQWELLRSDGAEDDVLTAGSQDPAKRILKVRGEVAAELESFTLTVFYEIA